MQPGERLSRAHRVTGLAARARHLRQVSHREGRVRLACRSEVRFDTEVEPQVPVLEPDPATCGEHRGLGYLGKTQDAGKESARQGFASCRHGELDVIKSENLRCGIRHGRIVVRFQPPTALVTGRNTGSNRVMRAMLLALLLALLALSCSDPETLAKERFDRAQYLIDRGRFAEALEVVEKGLAQWDGDARAHYNHGLCLAITADQNDAAAAFARALELRPDYPEAANNQGISYGKLGRHEEAIAAFRESIRQDGEVPGAHANLGVALFVLDRHQEALLVLQRAIELDPRLTAAHKNKGLVLYELARFDEAAAAFERTLEIRDDDDEARYMLGLSQLESGQHAEALTTLESFLERFPASPRLSEVRAEAQRARRLLDRQAETVVVTLKVVAVEPLRKMEYTVEGTRCEDGAALDKALRKLAARKASAPLILRPLVNYDLRARGIKSGVQYQEMVAVLDKVIAAGFTEARLEEVGEGR